MGNLFAGSEVVELGVQIEKNGRDFYNALADQSKNQKSKDMFTYLAGEEGKHIVAFQKILNSVQKYEPTDSYPGEYFAYMNALAREHVFTQKDKGAELAKGIKNDKEAIGVAMKFEEDSIVFFEGMKKVVRETEHKVIEDLVSQEQQHVQKLLDIKKGL
ncbi:MAG: ferritin family protein [Candidatus Omnitrophica bacterium]|nr:ferritin family protein [Candidatus Omnitrophota bacterium]